MLRGQHNLEVAENHDMTQVAHDLPSNPSWTEAGSRSSCGASVEGSAQESNIVLFYMALWRQAVDPWQIGESAQSRVFLKFQESIFVGAHRRPILARVVNMSKAIDLQWVDGWKNNIPCYQVGWQEDEQ